MSNCGAVWSRPACPSTAAILARYKLRSMRPIISQIDRALWSSSIPRSTSTVRKTSCERSIDERRGRGESEDALTLVVYRRYQNRNSPELLLISSHLPDGTFTWLLRLLLRRRLGALKPQKKWWRVYDFQQSASPVCFDQKSPTTNLQAATP